MDKLKLRKIRLNRRKFRIKKRLKSIKGNLRLCISKTNKNFYAQIIDDNQGVTLLGISTLSSDVFNGKNTANKEAAVKLGQLLAKAAIDRGITQVVFDRNGYLYHGKIKAFADSVREAGLKI